MRVSEDEIFSTRVRLILMWHCHFGFLPFEQEVWHTHIVGFAAEKAARPRCSPKTPAEAVERLRFQPLFQDTHAVGTEREGESFIYKICKFPFQLIDQRLGCGEYHSVEM